MKRILIPVLAVAALVLACGRTPPKQPEVDFVEAGGKHNYVNTREELKERDPGLYDLLAEYFPATDQQISKHKFVNECTKENSRTH